MLEESDHVEEERRRVERYEEDLDRRTPYNDEKELESEDKAALGDTFGTLTSSIMIIAVVVNVVLLVISHIGINLVVLSSYDIFEEQEPTSAPTSSQNETIPARCDNPVDRGIWEGIGNFEIDPSVKCESWDSLGWERACPYGEENAAKRAYNDVISAISFRATFGDDDIGSLEVFQQALGAEWGFSSECSSCMFEQYSCASSECLKYAIAALGSEGCPTPGTLPLTQCVQRNCMPVFIACSGLEPIAQEDYVYVDCPSVSPTPAGEEHQTEKCTKLSSSPDIEMFTVFEVTFGNAISEAFNGGAYAIGVLILVASGIWPYLKNVLMLFTWFAPLSGVQRDKLLLWLSRLGRFSLVDVFVVIIIVVGLRMDKELSGSNELVVRSQTKFAIFCFAMAAILALLQGEYIRYLNRKAYRMKAQGKKTAVPAPLSSFMRRLLQVTCAFTTTASLVLLAGFFAAPAIRFDLTGVATSFSGPNFFEYNGFQIGSSLVDECQLGKPSEKVMFAFFIVTMVICPLISLFGYMVLALAPSHVMLEFRKSVRFLNFVANFSCLDVFLLSAFVMIVQFEPLVDGSIGLRADSICGSSSEDCIVFKGKLLIGTGLLTGAVVAFWLTQHLALRCQKYWRFHHAKTVAEARHEAAEDVTFEWK